MFDLVTIHYRDAELTSLHNILVCIHDDKKKTKAIVFLFVLFLSLVLASNMDVCDP